jgi:hypothetical protein
MIRRLGRFAARVALVVVCLLVVAEISLRAIGMGNPVRYAYDKDCGYLPAPSQHARRFFAQNDINSFSMRAREISARKDPNTFRVLFLGDSVTYGTTYIDQKRIFTGILEERLPRVMNKKVEVLNVSAGGWGVGNEVGYLLSRGTFEADLVVMVLNTSDPVQGDSKLTPGDQNYPTDAPATALGELVNRYVLPRISSRFIVKADAGSQAYAGDTLEGAVHVNERLTAARNFAHANGAGFALAYVPFRHEESKQNVYVQAHTQFAAFCDSQKIPLLDMTEEICSFPESVTHMDGAHLRPEGHQIVAARFEREWTALLANAAPDARRTTPVRLAIAKGLERE